MPLNRKVSIISFLIILLASFYSYKYYKKIHPKYILLPPREELTITIIPGWNLRNVAEYFVEQKIVSSTQDVYAITGRPAYDYRPVASMFPKLGDYKILTDKPAHVSYEGYLAPETYRIFKDASVKDVLVKLVAQREKQITEEMLQDIKKSGRSFYEILIMASILEKEVKFNSDRAKVADLLWRRYDKNWALQVDSSVHYAVDKRGEVFTKKEEREFDSPWNTYKYPGLPLGPISNPGIVSITAAIYPEKNSHWFFLTAKDGTVYYANTLEEHNANKKYL
ncbi:MAG: endolytic transglycosylase MltG [Patescibacteria group bacterium]